MKEKTVHENLAVVDLDTGEILDISVDELIEKKQRETIQEWTSDEDKKLRNESVNVLGGNYYNIVYPVMGSLFGDISNANLFRLLYAASFMNRVNQLVEDKKHMTLSDLRKKMKLTKEVFNGFYEEVKKAGLLFADEDGFLYLNAKFFVKGTIEKRVMKHSYYKKISTKAIRWLYEDCKNAKNHSTFGRLYRIIPRVNTNFNVLCYNPAETNLTKIKPISEYKALEYMGVTHPLKKKFKEVSEYKLRNNWLIRTKEVKVGEDTREMIFINPMFYHANPTCVNDFVLNIFKREPLKVENVDGMA